MDNNNKNKEYMWAKALMVMVTARTKSTKINLKQSIVLKNLEGSHGVCVNRIKRAVEEGKKCFRVNDYGDVITIPRPYMKTFLRNLGGDCKKAADDLANWIKDSRSNESKAMGILKEIMLKADIEQQSQVIQHLLKIKDLLPS